MTFKTLARLLSMTTASLLVANAAFVVANGAGANQAPKKQDICHLAGGQFSLINISQNAVAQHIANHGDVLAGTFFADADGDGYGNAAGATNACPTPGFVNNDDDAFPSNPSEHADSDGDGVGNNGDAFPNDPTETRDSDRDGVGDNGDAFPNDPTETRDSDRDGVGDNGDAFPNNPAETRDSDGDGVGDNGDAFPFNPAETADSDGDGIGDNGDACPSEAGSIDNNGCPAPALNVGSDLVIGKAGEFGHPGKMAMLFGDGGGGFASNEVVLPNFQSNEVAVGDVNNDGKDDVVVVASGGQVWVARGPFLDGLQFSDLIPVGVFTEVAPNCCDRTRVVQLGDINNDGKLDIAVTQWAKLAVMLGNGDGTFGSAIQSGATDFDNRGMALGDLDGDGKLDLVANNARGNWSLWFHRGNGNGTFQPGVFILNSELAIPNIFLRDAEGDGDLDIYTGALNGRLKIFTNNGSASFTKTDVELGTGFQGGLLVVDDLNGDGTPDAVAGTEANNFTNVRVWLSNGMGGFVAADYGPVGSLPRHAVIADVNKDGKKDVAMVTVNIFGGNPGSLWILLGNGDGTFAAPYSVATYRNNFTIGAGNFD